MNRLFGMLAIAVLMLALNLSGCAGRREQERAPERQGQSGKGDQKQGKAKKDEDPVSAGAENRQSRLQEKARDADQAWTKFEAEVRDRSKEEYRAVEDSLHAILAQVRTTPVDARKLKQEIAGLDEKLVKLAP